MQQGSDVLTSYVMSIAHDAGLSIPQQTEAAMVKGLTGFIDGSVVRYGAVATADLPLRKIAAIDALARFGNANSSMLGSITIDPNPWPDLTMIQWWDILLRLSDVPDRARQLTEAGQIMRARINWQGTGAHLTGQRMWWLMSDSESATAQLVLLLTNHQLWRDDVPRLMQGAIRMQTRGSWSTTLANAGTLAVEAFNHAFEAVHVGGVTNASLDSVAHRIDRTSDPNGGNLNFAWPPKLADLRIDHVGAGQPWAEIRTRAAIPLKSSLFSGYRITKTFSPIEGGHAGACGAATWSASISRIDAATDMTWVVVNDPIPAGASQLGSGLMRQSSIELSGESAPLTFSGLHFAAYTERSFDSFRAYYEFVPKGPFDVEYTIRLNQPGKFLLPATRVEALYEPEMFGEFAECSLRGRALNEMRGRSSRDSCIRDRPRPFLYWPTVPSFQEVRADWRPSDAELLDRHGAPLQELRVDLRLRRLAWTALDEISPVLPEAVIASEDRRFFDHHGVDLAAMLGAIVHRVTVMNRAARVPSRCSSWRCSIRDLPATVRRVARCKNCDRFWRRLRSSGDGRSGRSSKHISTW